MGQNDGKQTALAGINALLWMGVLMLVLFLFVKPECEKSGKALDDAKLHLEEAQRGLDQMRDSLPKSR